MAFSSPTDLKISSRTLSHFVFNMAVVETEDYEKIAAAAMQTMKAADLNRFLVVGALVSDLYCPRYNPRQPLEKNSNLARTAARYKIDKENIATGVRKELTRTKHRTGCTQIANETSREQSPSPQNGKGPKRKSTT